MTKQTTRKKYTKLCKTQTAYIENLLRDGMSNKHIAKELGISHQLVNYYRKLWQPTVKASKTERFKAHGPRIVTLDIETSPIEAHVWSLWKQNVGLNQIKRDWTVLSVAWKVLGVDTVHYADVSKEADVFNDMRLMGTIWQILDDADIIVAQNGKAFDQKKINARLIQLGFAPPAPYKVVDTLLMAKSVARFTSNKLEWLSGILTDIAKDKHNEFPGFDLWAECMNGNPLAWAAMKKYNLQDIPTCEAVYLKLRPWAPGHPNVAMYYDDEERRCPRCGDTNLILQDKPVYTQSGEYEHYRCGGCQGFSRGRYTLNSKAKRKAMLTQ